MKCTSQHILICICALWIGGSFLCCTNTVKKGSEAFDEPPEIISDENPDNFISYAFVDSVQVLAEINRKVIPFNGRFCSAQSWKDKLGSNILVISESGEYFEGNGRKEIFVYHYIKRDSIYDVLWQMNDFVDGLGCDLDIQLINYFPVISDIDTNGIAESAIFYSLNNRCDAVPFPAKLIIHEGKDKFAIRGIRSQFLGPSEDVNNEYRANDGLLPLKYKSLDKGYSEWDTSIINYYSYKWDKFISLENELKGALTDSLVNTIN